jgi:hypothetical protein
MYTLDLEARVEADLDSVWTAWTDMERYPEWDPREEVMTLDGPFAEGATGFSKQAGPRAGGPIRITRVEAPGRFTVETPLPLGRLVLDHWMEPSGPDRVLIRKRYQVHGPMSVAFRLFFTSSIRSEMPATFAALESEAQRRASLARPAAS